MMHDFGIYFFSLVSCFFRNNSAPPKLASMDPNRIPGFPEVCYASLDPEPDNPWPGPSE